jgi:predicted short-subunit dehydrogenase-like oxidoreductase (DUF2520 family)
MTSSLRATGIAGTGRLAQALGRLLADAGEPVAVIGGRDEASTRRAAAFVSSSVRPVTMAELPARADRILVAVSDDAIAEVAAVLARSGMRSGIALHTSGAHGPELLAPLRAAEVSCGVLHPLQTVPSPERGAAALRGAAFGVGGDADALEWAEEIVRLLGGRALHVSADGFAAYHAGAVMASNAVVAALDAAVVLMGAAGVDRRAALDAVGPLCLASARNTIDLGPEAALTGPVQRGDARTVAAHAAALGRAPRHVADLYRASARALLDISRRRGLADASACAIEEALER